LIKSLGLTNQEIKRLNLATLKILQLELKKVRSLRSIAFIQGTLVNFLRQSILFILLYLAFKDKLDVGQVATLQMFSFFIFNPLQEMGNVLLSYREAEASLNNFKTILDAPLEKKPANPAKLTAINKLEFKDVYFQHKTAKKPAVRHINFTVNKGQTVAFVGPSGSGKTILLQNMILNIYKNCFSRIYIFSPSIEGKSSWLPVKDHIEKEMKVRLDLRKRRYTLTTITPSRCTTS
jgi:ATP-binding cassette subfamily B protein